MGVDPVAADPANKNGITHQFNRYTFANNNPYKYSDPDGREVTISTDESRSDYIQLSHALNQVVGSSKTAANMYAQLQASADKWQICSSACTQFLPGELNKAPSNFTVNQIMDDARHITSIKINFNEPVNALLMDGRAQPASPAIRLGHEMSHATKDGEIAYPNGASEFDRTKVRETYIIQNYENAIRSEMSMPLRNPADPGTSGE